MLVREAADTIGGGARTEELTLPGFRHDVCSAFHPLAAASPFLRRLPLEEHGLEWVRRRRRARPPARRRHGRAAPPEPRPRPPTGSAPDGGRVSQADRPARARLAAPRARDPAAARCGSRGIRSRLARFGLSALRSAEGLARTRFRGERGPRRSSPAAPPTRRCGSTARRRPRSASCSSCSGTSRAGRSRAGARRGSPTRSPRTSARSAGEIETGTPVTSLDELPRRGPSSATWPLASLVRLAGDRLPSRYRRALGRYRYGPGAFKLDLALDGPIPWSAPDTARAACVHLGGTLEEIAGSERRAVEGRAPERPFLIVGQHTLFDPTRAPDGKHTAWAYSHVPNGWAGDATEAMEAQIERFAPGFRDRIVGRRAMRPAGDREAQSESRRRRRERGAPGSPRDPRPPRASARSLGDSGAGALPLLGRHAARRGRPRTLRVLGRRGRPPRARSRSARPVAHCALIRNSVLQWARPTSYRLPCVAGRRAPFRTPRRDRTPCGRSRRCRVGGENQRRNR